MTRARELANFADDVAGLETLTVSDVTDLSVSASNINSATNQIIDSSTDLNVDSNTLVVDKSANTVGIGGASGGAMLDVNGTCALGNGADISGGHVAIKSDGTGTDGAFFIANNDGTALLKVLDNGNIGVGLSTPSYPLIVAPTATGAVPTNALVQQTNSNVATIWNQSNSATYSGLQLETRTSGASGWLIANEWQSQYLGDLIFRNRNAGTTSAERMRIRSDGNVGIGTPSPATQLEIEGAVPVITIDTTSQDPGIQWARSGTVGYQMKLNNANLLYFYNSSTKLSLDATGHLYPGGNGTQDLGKAGNRWQNVYTADLHLSNEGSVNDVDGTSGDWTIQEGSEDLFIINNKSGKQYKIKMEEV